MVFIAGLLFSRTVSLDLNSAVVLLVLPIPIGWVFTILLHARLNTDFHLLSTKDKLINLLSTTWVTIPVRRMEDRDQRHKGRETFFALLLAGFNLVGTSAALVAIVPDKANFNSTAVISTALAVLFTLVYSVI